MKREHPVQFCRRLFVSFFSFFNCIKSPKIESFAICFDVGPPFASFFVKRYAFFPTFICGWGIYVLHILRSICNSKIAKSVIGPNSVYMINFPIWPRAIHNDPSNPMSPIKNIINSNHNIASSILAPDFLTSEAFSFFNAPRKNPCDRIIGDKFLNSLNARFAHDGNMAIFEHSVKGKFL